MNVQQSSDNLVATSFDHANELGWFTVSQVAKMVGRSSRTIVRWRVAGLIPSRKIKIGQLDAYVYDSKDVALMSRIAVNQRRGRKKAGFDSSELTKLKVRKRRKVSSANGG